MNYKSIKITVEKPSLKERMILLFANFCIWFFLKDKDKLEAEKNIKMVMKDTIQIMMNKYNKKPLILVKGETMDYEFEF